MQLPVDKVKHFFAGLIIALIVGFIVPATSIIPHPALIGLAAAIAAGAGKEFYDWWRYDHGDPYDLAVTVIGGIIGAFIVWFA